jgi:hypothetical protein
MTTPIDVFPRDDGEKRTYVVLPNRVLHIDATRHYASGTEVAVTVERAEAGLTHILAPVDAVQPQESETDGALTRAAAHPRRRVKARKK